MSEGDGIVKALCYGVSGTNSALIFADTNKILGGIHYLTYILRRRSAFHLSLKIQFSHEISSQK